jgi:HTH-type transcriptional regulator/antitoxin HipB
MRIRSPTDLGLVIREQRKRLGLGQRELARKVGVSRQWIVEIEKGKPRAELGLVLRTLAALELALRVGRQKGPQAQPSAGAIPPIDIDAVIERARGKRP